MGEKDGLEQKEKMIKKEKKEKRKVDYAWFCDRDLRILDARRNKGSATTKGLVGALQASSFETSGARNQLDFMKEIYGLQVHLRNKDFRTRSPHPWY